MTTVYTVRDDGYNLLAWSPVRGEAEAAAKEIDRDHNRAVRVSEEEYDAAAHGEDTRYSPLPG